MSEILMTLCDDCAERLDADRHPENTYYLTEVPGSRRPTQCSRCFQQTICRQYGMKSKAIVAMERELKRREGRHLPKKDRRAHYREPFGGGAE